MQIDAQALGVVIDRREILRDVALSCPPGHMSALVGPSGSGKTTLLHCLGLLQQPTTGQVLVDGRDTTSWSSAQRRAFWRDHAAFVLQDYGVMNEESVAFNVTMALSVLGRRAVGDRRKLEEALEITGLGGRGDDLASHLSGGEKQRLGVARAIYKDARCIFVDEPTASLDEANRRRVIALFAERAAQGCTVVVASHDDEMIAACSDRYDILAPRRAEAPRHDREILDIP